MDGDVEDRALAVDKIVRIGGQLIAVCGELLASLGCWKEVATWKHCEVCKSSRKAVGQL